MKYQYSPGLFGYGAKGSDGSAGLQGMSLYFTDYDVVFNKTNIEYAIENNYVMWSSMSPTTPLPNSKTYVTKDLFVVPNGNIYEIDASLNTFSLTAGKLSKVDLFTYITALSDGFQRWENTNNSSVGYLIDNVNSMVSGDYTLGKTIYSIPLKEFTRIEVCDVVTNNKMPFTLYSIGENAYIDDNQSLALVYDTVEQTFRIGNIDDVTGLTRSTNLVLDASTVQYNRPQPFGVNTTIGTVLTKKEINKPLLFSAHFVSNPTSFNYITINPSTVEIRWKLSDFNPLSSSSTNIRGDLHFYKDASKNRVYNLMDASAAIPMIFHNVQTDGSVRITGLDALPPWSMHMMLKQNGWERQSDVLPVQP